MTSTPEKTEGREELLERVRAGEWLSITLTAQLLRVERRTVWRWVAREGQIRYRETPFGKRKRKWCDPRDVLLAYEERNKIRSSKSRDFDV